MQLCGAWRPDKGPKPAGRLLSDGAIRLSRICLHHTMEPIRSVVHLRKQVGGVILRHV